MSLYPVLSAELARTVMVDRHRQADEARLARRARPTSSSATPDSETETALLSRGAARLRRAAVQLAVVAGPFVYLLVETAGTRKP